jgi:hypothetical protein
MKRMLMLAATLFFSTYCFAEIEGNINSAIQNAISNNSTVSQNALTLMYSGKDISRPKMLVVSDEKSSSIQSKIIS